MKPLCWQAFAIRCSQKDGALERVGEKTARIAIRSEHGSTSAGLWHFDHNLQISNPWKHQGPISGVLLRMAAAVQVWLEHELKLGFIEIGLIGLNLSRVLAKPPPRSLPAKPIPLKEQAGPGRAVFFSSTNLRACEQHLV